MNSDAIQLLASNNIHCYGSAELLKFEEHMTLYFEREYQRWHGNNNPPEQYGTSSFEGNIANKNTYIDSIDHYNKELKIYQAFLDADYMCYTMGYFGATNQSPKIDNEITLTRAQINKFDLIIDRAEIRDGQNILELGSGFGGFAQYLLSKFQNIRLTVINPCQVQTSYLWDTMLAEDTSFNPNRVKLIEKYLDDLSFNDLKENDFDRAISIGVLEAVTNLDKLFKLISRALKPGGKTLHHFIVSAYTIPRLLNAENTLMENYFPGGHIWPYSELKRHNTHLQFADSWFINGMNYWKTLDEWHKRFWQEIDHLYPDYLSINEVQDWNKYFVLCKTMFKPNQGKSYGVGHYLLIKD